MKLEKILVPVDDSYHSSSAVRYAAGLAEMSGAEVLLLHCHQPVPLSVGEPNVKHYVKQMINKSQVLLAPLGDILRKRNITVEERAVGGKPATVIADTARTEKFDLIVIGSKGKSDLEGLIVGSVTHKVLHIAACPVLVVH
jgi:nucleotide-binding universal stress UspA family protein